jgi:hypothetical protein
MRWHSFDGPRVSRRQMLGSRRQVICRLCDLAATVGSRIRDDGARARRVGGEAANALRRLHLAREPDATPECLDRRPRRRYRSRRLCSRWRQSARRLRRPRCSRSWRLPGSDACPLGPCCRSRYTGAGDPSSAHVEADRRAPRLPIFSTRSARLCRRFRRAIATRYEYVLALVGLCAIPVRVDLPVPSRLAPGQARGRGFPFRRRAS